LFPGPLCAVLPPLAIKSRIKNGTGMRKKPGKCQTKPFPLPQLELSQILEVWKSVALRAFSEMSFKRFPDIVCWGVRAASWIMSPFWKGVRSAIKATCYFRYFDANDECIRKYPLSWPEKCASFYKFSRRPLACNFEKFAWKQACDFWRICRFPANAIPICSPLPQLFSI
jgi:hypothetical protein